MFLIGESCMATTKNQFQNLTLSHGTPRSNDAIAVSCCMPIDAFWHGSLRTTICTVIHQKLFFLHLLSSYTTTNYIIEILSQFCFRFKFFIEKKSKFELFDPVMTLSDLTLRSKIKIDSFIVFYA